MLPNSAFSIVWRPNQHAWARLVEDLLDFSGYRVGASQASRATGATWLVLEAAVGCLPRTEQGDGGGALSPRLPAVMGRPRPDGAGPPQPHRQRRAAQPRRDAVEVSAQIEGATVAISVTDDGTGVPEDVAAAFLTPSTAGVPRPWEPGSACR